MQKNTFKAILPFILIIFLAQASSALAIKSVDAPNLFPGQEAEIRIEVENTLDKNIEDVSFSLNFVGLPLSSIGSSEDVIDKLDENEDDAFVFKIRASSTAEPQDYKVPYTLSYKGITSPRTGVITIRVVGNAELSVLASAKTPVLGYNDELTIKIINKGFANARYSSVKLFPIGFSLYSDDTVYIGDISSDDFETAIFNVKYTSESPSVEALIEYLDFNNQKQSIAFKQNLKIYTQKEAISEGIISKNNTSTYIFSIIILIVLFFIWRAIRKRIRKKRSLQRESSA